MMAIYFRGNVLLMKQAFFKQPQYPKLQCSGLLGRELHFNILKEALLIKWNILHIFVCCLISLKCLQVNAFFFHRTPCC